MKGVWRELEESRQDIGKEQKGKDMGWIDQEFITRTGCEPVEDSELDMAME